MSKKHSGRNARTMDKLVCTVCGRENESVFTFCEKCCSRLVVQTSSPKETSEATFIADEQEIHETVPKRQPLRSCGKHVLICMMVLSTVCGYMILHAPTLSTGENYTRALKEGEEPKVQLLVPDVKLTDYEWCWEWSHATDAGKAADVVMAVVNEGQEPITDVAFKAVADDGAVITDMTKGGYTLVSVGSIAPGEKGLLTGTVIWSCE